MANCILSYKDSLNNSKEFLKSIDAIDDSLYINNRELFEEAVDQLEEEAVASYNVEGKTWLVDPARPNYAIPNTAVLNQIDTKRKQLGIYDSQEAGVIVTKPDKSNTSFQIISDSEDFNGKDAPEKTIRDIAARMSDRIGIPVKFISDRSQKFKGKIEDNVAVINLAYATLDTPIHEILGHPIIRVLKMKSEQNIDVYLQEMVDKGIIKKEC